MESFTIGKKMSLKILVIDDSQVERDNLKGILSSKGYAVVTAEDGESGAEMAVVESPDLIFLDVVMPKKDGFKTCRLIKKNDATKDIPIVMVTSKAQKADKVMSQLQGAVDHIAKPYTDEEILDVVSKLG